MTDTPFNPLIPDFQRDPYAHYARYRERDPVHFGAPAAPGREGTFYLFCFDDVASALKDPRFIREGHKVLPAETLELPEPYRPFWEMARKWMLFRDPPDHTRLRALVSQAFTPKRVAGLAPHIEAICERLLDEVAAQGEMDLIADYAFPLPVTVISELLGVRREDHRRFRQWSAALAAAIDLRSSTDVYLDASRATLELSSYLREIVAERRQAPQDDLISAMIKVEEEGERLSEDELVAMSVLLLVAGHETTVNLIGNGVLALLKHPHAWQQLQAEPALLERAIEELLRFDSPVQMTFRFVTEPITLRGKTIPRGEQVGLVLGSANRDPAQFHEPDKLDVTREPNRHAAFGLGIHFCLGAPLARLEGKLALKKLLERAPRLQLATPEVRWRPGIGLRGLEALPVRF